MKRFLSYNYNFEKFVAAMTHMAMKVADLTKLRAAKLLYFADKYHLTNYGRPIIGDYCVKMDHGPVPSQSLDLMNELVSPYVIRGAKRPSVIDLSLSLFDWAQFRQTKGAIKLHLCLCGVKVPDPYAIRRNNVHAPGHHAIEGGSVHNVPCLSMVSGLRDKHQPIVYSPSDLPME
jgi:hypothetical protein